MDVNENIGKILILRRVLDGYSRICDASQVRFRTRPSLLLPRFVATVSHL